MVSIAAVNCGGGSETLSLPSTLKYSKCDNKIYNWLSVVQNYCFSVYCGDPMSPVNFSDDHTREGVRVNYSCDPGITS